VSDVAQTVLVLAGIVLAIVVAVVAIRLLVRLPGWIRRTYRPERRAIRVIGVGGGGSNAVDRMVAARVPGVSFVTCNTDAQALRRSHAATKVRIGESTTRGLGSGGDPEVGRRSAEEDEAKIARSVAGSDLVFIISGLGGGTGSGAAPIIGADARLQGALTIAVVTKPFAFEGAQRRRIAEAAVAELATSVDAIITIPNDRVADVVADDASMVDAFGVVDDVLLQAVRGILDLLSGPGLINLDFADVRAVMQGAGPALIGLGRGSGEDRALDAARQAVASPLLEASIQGARGILFNVSGPPDLQLREVRAAADEIRASADADANVIFGAGFGRPAGAEVLITLIATGLAWPEGSPVATRAAARKTADKTTVDGPAGSAPVEPDPMEPAPPPVEAPLPATNRRKRQSKSAPSPVAAGSPVEAHVVAGPPSSSDDEIDLDMPSFLRRRTPPRRGTGDT
jgi:cell division protein FtsZ